MLADVQNILFSTGNPGLDLTMELVVQATTGGPWGTTGGCCGDFNIFSDAAMITAGPDAAFPLVAPNTAPNGTLHFEITTSSGDQPLLTSYRPDSAAVIQMIDGLLLDE